MFVVIKLVVFRARFVQSDMNLPKVVNAAPSQPALEEKPLLITNHT
jgi:hypothetical protein